MDAKTCESLAKEIRASCPACSKKLAALDVLFDRGGNGAAADPEKPRAARKPDEGPRPLCEAGCGKKLRADSKRCESCGKRVCSRCWDRPADACKECGRAGA